MQLWIILLSFAIFSSPLYGLTTTISPTSYSVQHPASFNGSNLTTTSPGCTANTPNTLVCDNVLSAKLTDGVFGPLDSLCLDCYFAFGRNSSTRNSITFSLPFPISTIILYFFNSPTQFIGLPLLNVFGLSNISIDYFFDGNDVLGQTDSQLRNITLRLQQLISTVQINFSFPESSVIDWLLLSEVQFYNGTPISPSVETITFYQGYASTVMLGPDNLQSLITLSCTVSNAGSFEWQWLYNGNIITTTNRTQILIEEATRTSILTIDRLRSTDAGNYTCSVRYSTSNVTYLRQIELQLIARLTTPQSMFTSNVQTVNISCELSGYLMSSTIQWKQNNNDISLTNDTQYTISILGGNNSAIDVNGVMIPSIVSVLTIVTDINTDIEEFMYTCFLPDTELMDNVTFSIVTTTIELAVWEIFLVAITPVVVLIISFTFILLIVVVVLRKKWKIKKQATNDNRLSTKSNNYVQSLIDGQPQSTTYIPLETYNEHMLKVLSSQHIISVEQLQLLEKIGQGEFGVVYRGLLTVNDNNIPQPVAVKTLKGLSSDAALEEFNLEALKMTYFEHRNVLSLIGICIDNGPSPYIVMPFMSNGSLLSYLKKERHNLILAEGINEDVLLNTRKQLLSMCLQVADGMKYLVEQKFVHRDLAARNCMIDSNGVIKVSDFGLTEEIYSKNYFKQTKIEGTPEVKLPVKWMALESLHDGVFTEKTDVWSYGVLCWEVFSGGKIPYPGLDPQSVVKLLDSGSRPDIPSNEACSDEIYTLMMSCWKSSPDERPTFNELFQSVNELIKPLAGYIDLTNIL